MSFDPARRRSPGTCRRRRWAASRPDGDARRLCGGRAERRMSPAHVVEPTYEAIKRRLMAGGWAPGSRLESAKIADQLGVSVTPVRDCLYRLAGERMVDFTHGDGFHAHRLSETEYRDMLDRKSTRLNSSH